MATKPRVIYEITPQRRMVQSFRRALKSTNLEAAQCTRATSTTRIESANPPRAIALMNEASTKHLRTCPLCEGMCGVEVAVEKDRVISVRPDFEDVWSRGHICPKGTTLGELHHDADRLRKPMLRDGESWREASWSEAFERCEKLLHGVREKYGHAALSGYFGNMLGKSFGIGHYNSLFFQLAQFQSVYSSSTVDQQPKNLTCHLMYGDMWRIPIPDIDNTDLWIMFGANLAASKGSILAHRNVMDAIKTIRK